MRSSLLRAAALAALAALACSGAAPPPGQIPHELSIAPPQTFLGQEASVTIRLGKDTPAGYQLSGSEQTFTVGALGEITRTCVVIAPAESYIGVSDITLEVHADPGDVSLEKGVRFLGPNPQSLNPAKPETR